MRILISAGEASGDAQAALILRALREISPSQVVEAFGMGGARLKEEGLGVHVDQRDLLVMGFKEILPRLPAIWRARQTLLKVAQAKRPELAIVVDYPGFHFRLIPGLRQLGIPVVYLIPPKIWAWKKKRLASLQRYCREVHCVLPFEVSYYRKHAMEVHYVGNPLLSSLPVQLSVAQARQQLQITGDAPVVLVMPGSRPAEIDAHLHLFLEAVSLMAQELDLPLVEALIPVPAALDHHSLQTRVETWRLQNRRVQVRVIGEQAAVCMRAADVGIIKSGTSTLEAAIMDLPHLIAYRASALSEWIFRHVVRYRGMIGLSNLIQAGGPDQPLAKQFAVKELIATEAQSNALAQELAILLQDKARRSQLQEGFARVRDQLRLQEGPPGLIAAQRLRALLG